MIEFIRPWKLVTLALGIALLVAGSVYTPAIDWDIPISFGMAVATYLTAPWAVDVFWRRRWVWMPVAVYAAWFSVDGLYTAYWMHENPLAVELMREGQWPASLCMYLACGLLWRHKGDLRSLLTYEKTGVSA